MAAKVGVLAAHQSVGDTPIEFIKKTAADAKVHRLIAEPINKFLIRLLPIKEFKPLPATRLAPKPYIPETLPSPEVRGVYFEDPRFPHRAMELNA